MTEPVACPTPELLGELVLGRLAASFSRNLEAHLADCAACARTLDGLRNTDTLVDQLRIAATLPPLDHDSPTYVPMAEAADETLTPSPLEELAERLSPPSSPGEIGRLGGYAVLGVLGQGGMGVVYRAIDTQLGRHVALKTIKPSLVTPATRERFFREARAAAKLDHDHIVAVYQVGEANGVPFLAMPLLKGEPLDERLKREPRLPVAEAVRIARECAEGLAAAHEAGLVHRDIKPGNLWLEERTSGPPRVRILDFGLARGVGDVQLTQSGVVVGTPAYMAPEQAKGGTIDGRADLFSLGCVMYQALTGDRPFRGVDLMGTLMALATHTPTPVSVVNTDVPSHLSELVERLLAKSPEGRPASAREVVRALDALGHPAPARKAAPFKTRKRWPMVAGVLLAMAAAFAAVAVVRLSGDKGEVVIEADKDVEVTLKQGGKTVRVVDTKSGRTFDISAGEYDAEVRESPEGVVVATKKFTLVRGGKEVLSVRFEPKPPNVEVADAGEAIPALERDEDRPEELVAVLGSSRLRTWVTGYSNTYVRFSPDGRFVLVYGEVPKVRMWRADTFELVAEFERNNSPNVTSFTKAIFSPDGKTLAITDPKGVRYPGVRLWDVSGDKPVEGDLILKGEGTFPIAWSADGNALLATNPGDPDKSVVWRRGDNAPVTELPPMRWPEWGGLSRDGKLVVMRNILKAPMGGFVVWDISGEQPKEWKPLDKAELWGDLNDRLLAVIGGGGLTIYDLSGDKPVEKASLASAGDIVRWSPDGKRLAFRPYGESSLSLVSWDGRFGKPRTINLSTIPRSFEFSADGKRLVVATADNDVQVWDVASPKPKLLSPPPTTHGTILALSYGAGGKLLASCDRVSAKVWERHGATFRVKWTIPAEGTVSIALSPDGKTLAVSGPQTSTLWDLSGPTPVKGDSVPRIGESRLEFSADGKLLAGLDLVGDKDGVRVWEVAGSKRKQKWFVPTTTQGGARFAFAAGGRFVALQSRSANSTWQTEVWELNDPEPKRMASFETSEFLFGMSPDGKTLSMSFGAFFKWEEGKPPRYVGGAVNTLGAAFTADGKRMVCVGPRVSVLATPSDDAFRDGGNVARPVREWAWPGAAHSVAVSPDGTEFAVANGNGTIWIMRLDP